MRKDSTRHIRDQIKKEFYRRYGITPTEQQLKQFYIPPESKITNEDLRNIRKSVNINR